MTKKDPQAVRNAVSDVLGTEEGQADIKAFLDSIEDTGDEPEVTADEDATPGSSEGAQADVAADATTDESETQPEASGEGTDDVPTSYFGVDLSDLPAEKRAEIIAHFKEQDTLINKLQREKPEGQGQADAVDQPDDSSTAPEPVTDEALLQAFGLDPEDPFDERAAKVSLPLARQLLELKARFDAMAETQVLADTERYWMTSLDRLETEYGELPISRDAVLEFAAENSLGDPQDAYWRLMGPARQQLVQAAASQRAAQVAAAKEAASTTRPRTAPKTTSPKLESTNVKDAVAEAAKRVADELGLDWGDAAKQAGLVDE